MGRFGRWGWLPGLLALLLPLAACGDGRPDATGNPTPPPAPGSAQPAGWKAVLIAGDDQEPAFDNAVGAIADKLAGFGVPRSDMTVLKASASGNEAASGDNIRSALSHLDPGPGEGCFVYLTSHGAHGRGLVMKRARAFLAPDDLDRMLFQGCGDHPTVVIASGCYSGIFAEAPSAASNRVVLTAARDDRPSFGCNAQLQYTVFDRCALENIEAGESWSAAMDRVRACVSREETALHVDAPSEPQLAIGADERGLRVFAH